MKFHEWQELQIRMATEQLRKIQQEELETGRVAESPSLDMDGKVLLDITGWQSLKLKEGDIVILQPDREINPSATRKIADHLGEMAKNFGVKFMLMPYGWTASVLTPAEKK